MTKDYSLQYHVVIANASGTGSRAMWEFYQKEGMAAIGQFNLEIYFRIRSQDFIYLHRNERGAANEVVKGYYCVDWNVEVNQERLVDHKIDRLGSCNIKVNGRQLMDRYQDYESDNPQLKRKEDDEGYCQYWNVPIEGELSQAGARLKKATRDEIFNMMCEEDPQAERLKMLRPLYLVFASDKRSRSGSHFIAQMTR